MSLHHNRQALRFTLVLFVAASMVSGCGDDDVVSEANFACETKSGP